MASEEKITLLNGTLFYNIFIAGANKILENQKLLNKINVFPVPDSDTGTNLASTFRAVIDNARPDNSFKVTADAIALAALNGARGNSGVIFAQFLYGVSVEAGNDPTLSIEGFANTILRSVRYIYEAVASPVEGTMLTVIREWAEFIYSQKERIDDFKNLFHHSYEIALKSLSETTSRLKALSLANVVDAGAKGFVLFLEGIIDGLRKSLNHEEISASHAEIELTELEHIPDSDFNFRFCSEALIRSSFIDRSKLSESIEDMGDSLVIAGSEKMIRIHIHTDVPHLLFQKLREFGTISYQKADDMKKQHDTVYNRKFRIALVTDSTCDLPTDILDYYQVQMVPVNLHFGENQYLDKITIQPEQFYRLLETEKHFPSTSQPNEANFANLFSHLAGVYDSIIAVHLSGRFSGTLNSSMHAAERISRETGRKISVINSHHVSGSLGLLILRIAQSIEAGIDHDTIVALAESWRSKAKIYVSVKNLRNLIRGGRVSKMKGMIGNLLNMKPIVSLDDEGGSILFDKAFSQKGNMKKVMRYIREFLSENPVRNYVVLHAHAPETAEIFTNEMKELTGIPPISVINISPVVGLNAGEGTVAVAIMAE
jgi:DegV family protein with EDD domain